MARKKPARKKPLSKKKPTLKEKPVARKKAAPKKKAAAKKASPKKSAPKKSAAKRAGKASAARKTTAKKVVAKKVVAKKKAPAKKKTTRSSSVASGQSRPDPITLSSRRGLGPQSGGQSGDTQGLSRREDVDSESVEELLEEGQYLEAAAVSGAEDAPDADESEVHTREVLEDDVPEEYTDRDE